MLLTNMSFRDTVQTNSIGLLHVMIVQVQNPAVNRLRSGLCLTVNRFDNFVLVAALVIMYLMIKSTGLRKGQ